MGAEDARRRRSPRTRTYIVEDTRHGCYRDVKATLLRRGFCPWQRRSRQEFRPDFVWKLKEADIDWGSLEAGQIVNHFHGFEELGTKAGLSRCLRPHHLPDFPCSKDEFYPRSYLLGDPAQTAEFVQDFRTTALLGVVQQLTSRIAGEDKAMELPLGLVEAMLSMMEEQTFYSRTSNTGYGLGDHLGWSSITWGAEDKQREGLVALLLEYHYALLENRPSLQFTQGAKSLNQIFSSCGVEGATRDWSDVCRNVFVDRNTCKMLRIRLRAMMGWFSKHFPSEMQIQGMHSLWILKAPGSSRGIGVKVMHRLDDIMKASASMGWKIIQKYVENALLLPKVPSTTPSSPMPGTFKFDLRIWVLVTNWDPFEVEKYIPEPSNTIYRRRPTFQVHLYDHVYGRRCRVAYDPGVVPGECGKQRSLRHLTNVALQSRHPRRDDKRNALSSVSYHGVRKQAKKGPNKESDTTLVSQVELEAFLGAFSRENLSGKRELSDAELWRDLVWPNICSLVEKTMRIFRCKKRDAVTQRERSFQFLGFDVLLDRKLKPWLLEVNVSPGLSHSLSTDQNLTINDMINGLVDIVSATKTTEYYSADDKENLRSYRPRGSWIRLIHDEPLGAPPTRCVEGSTGFAVTGLCVSAASLRRVESHLQERLARDRIFRFLRSAAEALRRWRKRKCLAAQIIQRSVHTWLGMRRTAIHRILQQCRLWQCRRHDAGRRVQVIFLIWHRCRMPARRSRAAKKIQRETRHWLRRRFLAAIKVAAFIKKVAVHLNRSAIVITTVMRLYITKRHRSSSAVARCARKYLERRRLAAKIIVRAFLRQRQKRHAAAESIALWARGRVKHMRAQRRINSAAVISRFWRIAQRRINSAAVISRLWRRAQRRINSAAVISRFWRRAQRRINSAAVISRFWRRAQRRINSAAVISRFWRSCRKLRLVSKTSDDEDTAEVQNFDGRASNVESGSRSAAVVEHVYVMLDAWDQQFRVLEEFVLRAYNKRLRETFDIWRRNDSPLKEPSKTSFQVTEATKSTSSLTTPTAAPTPPTRAPDVSIPTSQTERSTPSSTAMAETRTAIPESADKAVGQTTSIQNAPAQKSETKGIRGRPGGRLSAKMTNQRPVASASGEKRRAAARPPSAMDEYYARPPNRSSVERRLDAASKLLLRRRKRSAFSPDLGPPESTAMDPKTPKVEEAAEPPVSRQRTRGARKTTNRKTKSQKKNRRPQRQNGEEHSVSAEGHWVGAHQRELRRRARRGFVHSLYEDVNLATSMQGLLRSERLIESLFDA